MTRWNINALTLYGSLMGNIHTFNVLRPLPGLMAFLIQRRIGFTSPKCRFGWFWTLWKYWVVRLRTISILDPILPVALIRLFSCWEPTLVPVTFCLLTECCTRQSGLCYDQMGLSPLRSLSLPPHQSHDLMNSTASVPTFDWKRHYDELMDQRRKNDTLSEKNQRLVSREVLERCGVAVGTRFH